MTYHRHGNRIHVPLLGALAILILAMAAVGSWLGTTAVALADEDDCRIEGHPATARFLFKDDNPNNDDEEDDNPDNDHLSIHGADPSDVIFRMEFAYEFALVGGRDCPPFAAEDGAADLIFEYTTTDSPLSGYRDGFLIIPERNETLAGLMTIAVIPTGQDVPPEGLIAIPGRPEDDSETPLVLMDYRPTNVPTDAVFDLSDPMNLGRALCARADLDRIVMGRVTEGGADLDDNYRVQLTPFIPDSRFLPYDDIDWTDEGTRIILTYCARGQGTFLVRDRTSDATEMINGTNDDTHERLTPAYPVSYSRIRHEIADTPGGYVAAQLLLTLISALLFWGASGPIFGGLSSQGGNPIQPFAGLTGMVLGALVLPIFGFAAGSSPAFSWCLPLRSHSST